MRSHLPWKKLGYAAGAAGLLLAIYWGAHYAAKLTNPVAVSQRTLEIPGPSRADSKAIPAPDPTGEGIPVSQLSPEILGPSRDGMQTIPLSALRRTPVQEHLVGPGDTLGIWIDGILGEKGQPIPGPPRDAGADSASTQPGVGYPIAVAEDGTLELPYVPALNVDKKTLPEVRALICEAYRSGKEPILMKGDERILVSLLQPRKVRVQVVREDANIAAAVTGSRRSYGQTLDLPIYENDVLSALDRTGGLPHLDASNEVVVEHAIPGGGNKVIRIPTRIPIGAKVPFSESDILLENGDIVFVEARDTDVYYTGGLMPSRQIMLPRDYDLHAREAVAVANGPILNAAVNSNNLNGNLLNEGLGNSSPSQLSVIRRTKNCGLITIKVDLSKAAVDPRENIVIQPGDFLVLQETTREASPR